MRNIASVLIIVSLVMFFSLVFFSACSKPADKPPVPVGESQQPAESNRVITSTPEGAVTDMTLQGEEGTVYSTSTTGTITPGGVNTGYESFDADLRTFLKGVVTDDRTLIEGKIVAVMRDKIDAAIKDLGFHEFAKGGDYNELWEKLQPLSTMSFTAVTGDSIVAVWVVNGKDAGMKNLQAQFDMVRVEKEWKVSQYTVISP